MEPLIESFNYILQNIINALQRGSFYAVISIGYSMVYGVLMLFNFAHGDIFMVGTYIGFGIATVLLAGDNHVPGILDRGVCGSGRIPAVASGPPGICRHHGTHDRHHL